MSMKYTVQITVRNSSYKGLSGTLTYLPPEQENSLISLSSIDIFCLSYHLNMDNTFLKQSDQLKYHIKGKQPTWDIYQYRICDDS